MMNRLFESLLALRVWLQASNFRIEDVEVHVEFKKRRDLIHAKLLLQQDTDRLTAVQASPLAQADCGQYLDSPLAGRCAGLPFELFTSEPGEEGRTVYMERRPVGRWAPNELPGSDVLGPYWPAKR